ncbi:MAG: hypothetical protein ACLR8Y_12905 [Alistipes indistinctus]
MSNIKKLPNHASFDLATLAHARAARQQSRRFLRQRQPRPDPDSPSPDPGTPTEVPLKTQRINRFIVEAMRNRYLWNSGLPSEIDITSESDPATLFLSGSEIRRIPGRY